MEKEKKAERANAPLSWIGHYDKQLDRFVLNLRLGRKFQKALKDLSLEKTDAGETSQPYNDGKAVRNRTAVRRLITASINLGVRWGIFWDVAELESNRRTLYFDTPAHAQDFITHIPTFVKTVLESSMTISQKTKGKVLVKVQKQNKLEGDTDA